MSTSDETLQFHIRGALLGAAIADALALPHLHHSRTYLQSLSEPVATRYDAHHSGFYPPGQYSDDTQYCVAALEAILDRGAIDAAEIASRFVPLWREKRLIDPEPQTAAAIGRIATGETAITEAGWGPGRAEITPATWALAPALWLGEPCAELTETVGATTALTHTDSRTLACSAAAAAGVAHNLHEPELVLGPFLDSMADAARRYDDRVAAEILDFPRILSTTEPRAWRHFATLLEDESYPADAEGLGSYCMPSLWVALYQFLRSPNDFERCVSSSIACGGHMDTAAFLCGALSGARVGSDRLPRSLVENLVEYERITRLADRLFEARAENHDRR